jgi:hypothetical protein
MNLLSGLFPMASMVATHPLSDGRSRFLRVCRCTFFFNTLRLNPGPCDLYPMTVLKALIGVSGFGVSQCLDFLSPRFPILRIPIFRFFGMENFMTHVLQDSRLWFLWCFETHKVSVLPTSKTPMTLISR